MIIIFRHFLKVSILSRNREVGHDLPKGVGEGGQSGGGGGGFVRSGFLAAWCPYVQGCGVLIMWGGWGINFYYN